MQTNFVLRSVSYNLLLLIVGDQAQHKQNHVCPLLSRLGLNNSNFSLLIRTLLLCGAPTANNLQLAHKGLERFATELATVPKPSKFRQVATPEPQLKTPHRVQFRHTVGFPGNRSTALNPEAAL